MEETGKSVGSAPGKTASYAAGGPPETQQSTEKTRKIYSAKGKREGVPTKDIGHRFQERTQGKKNQELGGERNHSQSWGHLRKGKE